MLKLTDENCALNQRNLAISLLKQLGKNFLTGNIMRSAIPVQEGVFVGKSQLQVLSEHLIGFNGDIIEFALESCFRSIRDQKKPFNPIIGESFYQQYGDVKIACEQIKNHPPTCLIRIRGLGVEIRSLTELEAHFRPNGILVVRKGYNFVMQDGKVDVFTFPDFKVSGLFSGQRLGSFIGQMKIWKDYKQNINQFSQIEEKPNIIINFTTDGQVQCDQADINISGDFNNGIVINSKKIIFTQQNLLPDSVNLNKNFSDCQLREDIHLFNISKYDESNEIKLQLEQKQRNDRLYRK